MRRAGSRTPAARPCDANVRRGRRLLVLDDDPTGSQSVHGVEAVILPGFGDLDAGGPMIGDLARGSRSPVRRASC